jgi:hypothetical protein
MELRIDSIKLALWYDETRQINTNAPISKEVLPKVKVYPNVFLILLRCKGLAKKLKSFAKR